MASNAMNSLSITIVHISYANMEFNSIFAKIRFFSQSMAKISRILVCWPNRYGGREGVEGGEGMIVPLKEADTKT